MRTLMTEATSGPRCMSGFFYGEWCARTDTAPRPMQVGNLTDKWCWCADHSARLDRETED